MEEFVELNNIKLNYIRYGSGKRFLFAFHGIGRGAEDFKPFGDVLGEEYTIISIDLFHHHKSVFPLHRIEKNPLTENEFKNLLNEICKKEGINKFSSLGYSFGGSYALKCIEVLPEKIEQVILIAADGISFNPGQYMVAYTRLGRNIYKHYLKNPSYAIKFTLLLRRWKILSHKYHKFLSYQMNTPHLRQQVYEVWTNSKNIWPDRKKFTSLINQYQIPLMLVYGKFDKIISPNAGKKFLKDVFGKKKMIFVEGGHDLINRSTAEVILREL
jgi:pimeloyl-ACP methyl ester carboxylesterase